MCKDLNEALLEDVIEITWLFNVLMQDKKIKSWDELTEMFTSDNVKDEIKAIAVDFEKKFPFETSWEDELDYFVEIHKFAEERLMNSFKQDEEDDDCGKRKVLITHGMSNDAMLIITDAPKEDIIKWCKRYNQAQEDGENIEPFDTLKTHYYVKELYDSEIDYDHDVIDIIGYDESYDLSEIYFEVQNEKRSKIPAFESIGSFKEFAELLQNHELESVLSKWGLDGDTTEIGFVSTYVECCKNDTYVDEDLYQFFRLFEEKGIKWEELSDRFLFKDVDGTLFVVFCTESPNRHDDELPDETIVNWDTLHLVKIEESGWISHERAMELLNEIINHVTIAENTSNSISKLVNMGFSLEELVRHFNFSSSDIEEWEESLNE